METLIADLATDLRMFACVSKQGVKRDLILAVLQANDVSDAYSFGINMGPKPYEAFRREYVETFCGAA